MLCSELVVFDSIYQYPFTSEVTQLSAQGPLISDQSTIAEMEGGSQGRDRYTDNEFSITQIPTISENAFLVPIYLRFTAGNSYKLTYITGEHNSSSQQYVGIKVLK